MTKVIVGLGNPGKEYETTRHNIGFMVVDHVSRVFNIPITSSRFKGFIGEKQLNGEKIILLKPQTYMNLSGESVRQVIDWYKVAIEDLLIIYDDLDLPVGKIRLRYKGSSGGHNGVKSIIQHTGSQEIKRIKVGIGRPPSGWKVPDYVLSRFTIEEIKEVDQAIQLSAQAIESWLQEPFEKVMTRYN